MARRRKGQDPFLIIAEGVALLVGIAMLSALRPGSTVNLRQMGDLVLLVIFEIIGLLLVLGIGWIIISRILKGTVSKIAPDELEAVESAASAPVRINVVPSVHDDSRNQPKPIPTPSLSEQLRNIDWFQFEKLVALAYGATGMVTRKGGANPDGGIDLILDRRGEQIGIQCKHWKSWRVGVKTVREMLGAMTATGLKKGIVVSLNPFTQEAVDFAAKHNIDLVDEKGVIELLNYLDQTEVQAILSDTRKVCPRCERELVLRTATRGPNTGGQFWGCSGYPKCSFVMQL